MISVINSWAQGIILAVIIATIIEIILPEGNNKKYVKTIIGIYILFTMIQPLVSKISNKNININSIIKDTTTQMSKYDTENLSIETNAYIEETYINKLKEDITEKMKKKEYNIVYLNLNIETENQENYGEIISINMKISKMEETEKGVKQNEVNEIAEVEIEISENKVNKEETREDNISQDEIKNIKEYLKREYGTEEKEIHINE